MFKDLKDIPPDSKLTYDLCIVGTGPAGISVTKQLLDTNFSIVVLESGGLQPEARYQELNKGENSGPSFLSLDASRMRCFGGAGKIWAGYCSPFKKDEFKKKEFIPLSGWPISLKDLSSYYMQAAQMLGISYQKFYDNKYFQDTFGGASFREFNRNNSLLSGNVFQVSRAENKDFSKKYEAELKSARNVDIIFHSTVTKLDVSNNGERIHSAHIKDLDGNKALINAKTFVLACGALENPRILLASNEFYEDGIGNGSGFVGSCFMSHPGVRDVGEIHMKSSGRCLGEAVYHDDYISQFEMSQRERSKQNTLRHAFSIYQRPGLFDRATYTSKTGFSHLDRLVEDFYFSSNINRAMCAIKGRYVPKFWNLDVSLEQPPRMSNYLNLQADKDSLGVPKINVHWDEMSQIEKTTVIKSVETLARECGFLNIANIKLKDELLTGRSFNIDDPINHHIGTTRMSKDSSSGVVDRNCKVFGISNLYIAGSSVFATSSVVNPTYTIIAMSLRLGDYLKNGV